MADYIDDGFHDNGDYELIPNQLEVSKNYILGKDRKGTFAYAMEHLIGIKNLLILDKCMLSKDWCAVKGIMKKNSLSLLKKKIFQKDAVNQYLMYLKRTLRLITILIYHI